MKISLLPCPACQTRKLRVFAWDKVTRYGECLRPGCRMSGPLGETDIAAAAAWNALPRNLKTTKRKNANG